jgi:hypothetical protein
MKRIKRLRKLLLGICMAMAGLFAGISTIIAVMEESEEVAKCDDQDTGY